MCGFRIEVESEKAGKSFNSRHCYWTLNFRVSANNSCQTEFKTAEAGSNTFQQKSQEVQTEKTEAPQPDVDMEKLGKWLNKIYPQVKEQIDNANNSKIFQNYRLLDDPIDATCKLVETLQVASKGETGSKAVSNNLFTRQRPESAVLDTDYCLFAME